MKLKDFMKPSWLIKIYSDKLVEDDIKNYAKGSLIDIGCGTKPYLSITKQYVTEHIGLDHELTVHDKSNIDIFSDAYNIPVEDEIFDTVLCSEVIEHLEEPDLFFKEVNRVLKIGSYGIISAPFMYHLHEEPRDFYRYTRNGLKYLAEKNNFELIKIRSRGGLVVTMFTEVSYCIFTITRNNILKPFGIILFGIILSIGFILSLIDPTKNLTPIGYHIIIKKVK